MARQNLGHTRCVTPYKKIFSQHLPCKPTLCKPAILLLLLDTVYGRLFFEPARHLRWRI